MPGKPRVPAGWRPGRTAPVRGLLAVAALVLATVALPAPAWAHGGGEAPDGTHYHTRVTGLSGPLPGVAVRAVQAGARLELVNDGAAPVEVLGYDGEPYLRIGPDGVFENFHSPATHRDAGRSGAQIPARSDPTAPPDWRRVSDEPRARWHDERSHWMEAEPPPQVTADPDRPHRIRNWAVPVRIGVTEAEIRGTLDWVPPPNPWLWWLLSLLGAGVVAALSLGLNLGRRSAGAVEAAGSAGSAGSLRRGATSVVPGSLCVVGGLAAIGYAVGREVDGGATGVVAVATGVFVSQLWPVLAGLGAIVVGLITTGLTTAVIRATGRGRGGDGRRPAGDFPLALAGVCLALFAGVSEAGVFGWGVAPVPFSPTLARVAVAAAIAIGAGTAVAAALRLRAAVPGSGPDTTAGAAGAAERQEAS